MNVVEIVTFPCSDVFVHDRAIALGSTPEAQGPGCLQYGLSSCKRAARADTDSKHVEPTMVYRLKRKMISMWDVLLQVSIKVGE